MDVHHRVPAGDYRPVPPTLASWHDLALMINYQQKYILFIIIKDSCLDHNYSDKPKRDLLSVSSLGHSDFSFVEATLYQPQV